MFVISNHHRDEILSFLDALQGLPVLDNRVYNLKRRALTLRRKLSEKSPVRFKISGGSAYDESINKQQG